MKTKEILEIFENKNVAFNVVALVQTPLNFLAYEIREGSEAIVFLTAEGEKKLSPDAVKAINLVSIQELVERINYLNERSEAIKKKIQNLV